jgi:hypothetical protein
MNTVNQNTAGTNREGCPTNVTSSPGMAAATGTSRRDRPILFSAPMVLALMREARQPGIDHLAPTDALPPPWNDLRSHCPAGHDINDRHAEEHHESHQRRGHRARVVTCSIKKQAAGSEYSHQGEGRVKDLHGLVNGRVNARSCLCLLQRASDDRGVIRAPSCFLEVLETLLRCRGYRACPRPVCQVTAHAKTFRGVRVRRPDSIRDCSSRLRHIRHAVLRSDRRIDDSLRDCRQADGQGGDSGKFIKRKHFDLLRKEMQRLFQPSSEVLIIEIDNPIGDPIPGIPSASGVLDLALAAFEEIDRFGPRVAEPVPQGVYRNSTREEPVSVGHREAHMLSRVRINNRGPARVTDDGHGKPLRFLSVSQKYPFDRQRIIEAERTTIAKIYFAPAGHRPKEFDELKSLTEPTPADGSSIIACCTVLIRWQPLAPVDALDIAAVEA